LVRQEETQGNQGNYLSTDLGLREFNVKNEKERIRSYRRYVYEAGAVNRPDKGKGDTVLEKERKRDFKLSRETGSKLE